MKILRIFIIGLFFINFTYPSEGIPTKEEVAKLYVATFNRAPDQKGLDYWINTSNLTLSQIAKSFFEQYETKALYPDSKSNTEFIISIYQNLFNRVPDMEGLNYWKQELNENIISRNRFIEAIINGAQNSDTSNDEDILYNKMIVGLSFSEAGFNDIDYSRNIMKDVTADRSSINSALSTLGIVEYRPTTTKDFVVINSGNLEVNQSVEKKFQIVRDQTKFNEIYKTFESNSSKEIDISNNHVAILTLAKKSSKAYSIKVTKIEEAHYYRTIFVETTIVDENCPKGEEAIAPFEIISFTSSPYLETAFEETIKIIKCDPIANNIFTTLSFRKIDLNSWSAQIIQTNKIFQIVQDLDTFENLYYANVSNQELPYVDFDNETLIALFLGEHYSSKTPIQVKSVNEYDNYIEIDIEREIIGSNCPVNATSTNHASFIAIPKTEKEIIFKDSPNIQYCEVPLDM